MTYFIKCNKCGQFMSLPKSPPVEREKAILSPLVNAPLTITAERYDDNNLFEYALAASTPASLLQRQQQQLALYLSGRLRRPSQYVLHPASFAVVVVAWEGRARCVPREYQGLPGVP